MHPCMIPNAFAHFCTHLLAYLITTNITTAPDRYFGAGANKMMFYGDPTNFGRPRQMDLMLSRQVRASHDRHRR